MIFLVMTEPSDARIGGGAVVSYPSSFPAPMGITSYPKIQTVIQKHLTCTWPQKGAWLVPCWYFGRFIARPPLSILFSAENGK